MLEDEVEVIEEWRVVDRWWTDEPLDNHYRVINRHGLRVTQIRPSTETEWTDTTRESNE